jgi:hypothetical protein
MQISLKRWTIFVALALSFSGFIATGNTLAQTPEQLSPVERGYYDEGYQDGVNDAQNNRSNDYKRYKKKYTERYESFYKQGYQAGYTYIKPNIKWTSDQKRAYDKGHGYGKDDIKKSISRLPERYEGKYDKRYEAYYRKGYFDGYDGRPKQYDTRIDDTGGGSFPGGGGTGVPSGNLSSIIWSGRVDDRVNITINGSSVQSVAVSGSEVSRVDYRINNTLPRRPVNVSVRLLRGRGEAFVIQQPSRANDYTAIVQVYDSRGGASDYQLDIGWETSNIEEPYQPGRVYWSGRVDNRVNVIISGDYVRSLDIAGTGMSNVNFNITGYLARRNGNIVSARKLRGRGEVIVIQQPTWDNDFTAIIQIVDNDRAADDYQIEISW